MARFGRNGSSSRRTGRKRRWSHEEDFPEGSRLDPPKHSSLPDRDGSLRIGELLWTLEAMGHAVTLIRPQYATPFARTNTNDWNVRREKSLAGVVL